MTVQDQFESSNYKQSFIESLKTKQFPLHALKGCLHTSPNAILQNMKLSVPKTWICPMVCLWKLPPPNRLLYNRVRSILDMELSYCHHHC